MRFPPKQPTIPLMPRTNPPNDKRHIDENTPLMLDDKVIGVCKKYRSGYVERIMGKMFLWLLEQNKDIE